jgi:hypothetical protein
MGTYAGHQNVKGVIQSFSRRVASRDTHWCVDPYARYKLLRNTKSGAVLMYILQDKRGTFTRALTDAAKCNTYEDFIRDFNFRFPKESPDTIFWKVKDLFQPIAQAATFKAIHTQLQVQAEATAAVVNAMHTRQTTKRQASDEADRVILQEETSQRDTAIPHIEEEMSQPEMQHPSEHEIQEEHTPTIKHQILCPRILT